MKGQKTGAAKLMLRCLELVAKGGLFFSAHPHEQAIALSGGMEGLARYRQLRRNRKIREQLRYMRRHQYVKLKRQNNRMQYVLTSRGMLRLLKYQIRHAPKLSREFIIVIFDIPEDYRTARNVFRKFLKENGFTMLQQSVWLSDRDVYLPLCEFIRVKKLERWLNVFRGTPAFSARRGYYP